MIETQAVYSAEANDFRLINECLFCQATLAGGRSAAQTALSKDRFCYSIYPSPFPAKVFALGTESAEQLAQQWMIASQTATLSIDVCHISQREGHPATESLQELGEAMWNLIETVKEKGAPAFESFYFPLIALRTPPSRYCPVLFCVPGAGDNATAFMELSSYTNQECAVYGLQARGIDGDSIPHRSIGLTTKACLCAIEKIGLQREIHILGHSYGGIVAFDLAVRMCNEGYSVKSLTLLDSTPPSLWPTPNRSWTRAEVVMQIVRSIELRIEESLGLGLADLVGRSEEQQLEAVHKQLVTRRLLPQTSSWVELRGPMRTFTAALRTRYSPRGTFQGDAYSIFAADHLKADRDFSEVNASKLAHWKTVVPKIVCAEVPGNHITMLRGGNAQRIVKYLACNLQ